MSAFVQLTGLVTTSRQVDTAGMTPINPVHYLEYRRVSKSKSSSLWGYGDLCTVQPDITERPFSELETWKVN